MRILLVPSFNFSLGRFEPYVPGGLLALQTYESIFDDVEIDIANPCEAMIPERFDDSSSVVDFFLDEFDLEGYDIFGFSSVCNSAHYALDIARQVKSRYPSSKIMLGGPYVTKLSGRILEEFHFVDAIFVGEGEVAFLDLLYKVERGVVDFKGIPGIRTQGSDFISTHIVNDLNELPFITTARDYFHWLSFQNQLLGDDALVPVEATRGCPLKCSFCSTKQIWGPKVRRKSAKRLIDEMHTIYRKTSDTFFSLTGDNVGVPRNQFVNFCQSMIENRNPFTWACSLKLDRLSPENLETMWDAGCRGLFIGIETASQETLRRVNKAARVDHEIEGINCAIDMGFQVETSFIIGFPWETEEDIKNTYDLHCKFIQRGAKRSQVGVLCPIPGTEIVAGEPIVFDSLNISLAFDGIPLSRSHLELVKASPDLFSHFGRYETPNIRRSVLKGYRDAAAQMSGLQSRRWRMERQQNRTRDKPIGAVLAKNTDVSNLTTSSIG